MINSRVRPKLYAPLILFSLSGFLAFALPIRAQKQDLTFSLGGFPGQTRGFNNPTQVPLNISTDKSSGVNHGYGQLHSNGISEELLSGTYRCSTVEVAGRIKPCKAPSLELNSDGSYMILNESGKYEIVAGRWLVLSASKKHDRARLDGKEIIFEFVSGGKKSRIIYRRKYQGPPEWVAS